MNFIEQLKEVFHLRAEQLDGRLQNVELKLGEIRDSIGSEARRLDWELKNVRVTVPKKAAGIQTELLKVPPGVYYELTHWGWTAVAAAQPALWLDSAATMLLDISPMAAAKQGKSDPNELVIPEGETLYGSILNAEEEATLFLQFRVYNLKPEIEETGTIENL